MTEKYEVIIRYKNRDTYEIHEVSYDGAVLYVCNDCHEMHANETYICQVCDCESLRIVPESELIN